MQNENAERKTELSHMASLFFRLRLGRSIDTSQQDP
jgi:hypothetical protein